MRARAAVTMAGAFAVFAMIACAHEAAAPGAVASSIAAVPTAPAVQTPQGDGGALPPIESEPETAITADCTKKTFLRTVLGDDRAPSTVEWIRCGRRDRVLFTAPDGARTTLFSNAGEEDVVEFEYVRPLALPGKRATRQLVYSVHTFGTGNIHDWRIIDRSEGALREWKVDNVFARWAPLLAQGEDVRKQLESGVSFDGGRIVVAGLVYGPGDANCCPTGGTIYAELLPADGILHVGKVWRDP